MTHVHTLLKLNARGMYPRLFHIEADTSFADVIFLDEKDLASVKISMNIIVKCQIDRKLALVQGMACCRQATRHYRKQCYQMPMTQYGFTRNNEFIKPQFKQEESWAHQLWILNIIIVMRTSYWIHCSVKIGFMIYLSHCHALCNVTYHS